MVFGNLREFESAAADTIRDAGEQFFTFALEVFGGGSLEFKQAAREVGQRTNRKGPALFMPLRAALTGVTHGPELGPLLTLIPNDEIRARLEHARQLAR